MGGGGIPLDASFRLGWLLIFNGGHDHMGNDDKVLMLKSMEIEGFKVELLSESRGAVFRVNATDGVYSKTRVFTSYDEASALFNSYAQGN